jgi:hypothetical protein
MSKKQNEDTDKRRTQVRALPKAEKPLSKAEQKKLKGGDWLMQPAGGVRPNGVIIGD